MTDELHYMSACEALSMFRTRELSPVELMEAVIQRAETVEPVINAFSETYYEQALAEARHAQERYAGDQSDVRALEGLPVALKDEHHIAGYKNTHGSLIYADEVADTTVPVAERVLAAGGIMHARTTNSEFSMAGFTHSRLWGITRNPWDPAYSSHGSSGGSGASLAAGTTTLATGSDIGGSIRGPASANGIVGFRPPYGRVPALPPLNYDHYFVAGPMARTVDDARILENVLAGPHPADIASLRPALHLGEPILGLAGLRIGLSIDLGGWPLDPIVRRNTLAAGEVLKSMGAVVEPATLSVSVDEIRRAMFIHFNSIFGGGVKQNLINHRDLMNPATIDFIELGSASAADYTYADGLALEGDIYQRLSAEFERFDAVIAPTIALPAFGAGEDYSETPPVVDGIQLDHWTDAHYTGVFSVTARCPVLNVPTGHGDNGIPTGMQIVGRTFDDATVFRIGRNFEIAQPWMHSVSTRPKL